MKRKARKPGMMTAALRRAIADSGMSFLALERGSGVLRQNLMKFARGERFLRLDHADMLAAFFGFKVIAPKRRKARKAKAGKGR